MRERLALEVYWEGARRASVPLKPDGLAIGRGASNAVVLNDPLVSKRHARVDLKEERVLLTDLESVRGTLVRGQRIRTVELTPGDEFTIGAFTLKLVATDAMASATPPPRERPAPNAAQQVVESLTRLADIVGSSDVQALLESILDQTRRLIDTEVGYLVLSSGDSLTPVLARRGHQSADQQQFSQTLCRKAMAQRQPVIIRPAGTAETIGSLLDRSVAFALALPLEHAGTVHGVLYLESFRVPENIDAALAILPQISRLGAQAVSFAIGRAQLIEESERWRWLAERTPQQPLMARTCRSFRMLQVLELIYKAAAENVTTLIQGESGTGKEITAHTIHALSDRKKAPFVAINCGAIPHDLMESELFGHEKGAFTGAVTRAPGRLELSHGGTLFLDEIGDLHRDLQVKLLRVLENRQFERVGGKTPLPWDARLVAATNRDLQDAVKRGQFREDLYYRLNVVNIRLPALRERIEDLEGLVEELLTEVNGRFKKKIAGVRPEAMAVLRKYSWPGNIRELRNIIERAFILEGSDQITAESLPFGAEPEKQTPGEPLPELRPLAEVLERTERDYIAQVLGRVGGNVSQAARVLGMSRVSLYRRLTMFGFHIPDTNSDPNPE
jgi:Nif-specific regulatory protein